MCLSHRSYSYVCKRWKCGRSTLHTSVNIMTNFNVRIIMNYVQIIIINKYCFLYRFNDICLRVKTNSMHVVHVIMFFSSLKTNQAHSVYHFEENFLSGRFFSYSCFFFCFSSSFLICFLFFHGSPHDRISTATFWGIGHYLCRKNLTNQTPSLKSWIFRT